MPEQWNKYEPTAARRHGKPGREVRPKSVTIDIHSHVAVPEAAKFVEPHLDWATIPLANFATPETKALTAKQEADIRGRAGVERRLADLDAMGIDVQIIAPPPPQCYYTVPLDIAVKATQMVNDGVAAFCAQKAGRLKPLGSVPMLDGGEAAKELERCVKKLGFTGVEVLTNAMVTKIEPGTISMGNASMKASVILWAAGVAASSLGKKLGAPVDRAGRVLVQPDLSIPGHPEVFVIGDLAALKDQSGNLLPGVAPVAILEGRFVAKLIRQGMADISPDHSGQRKPFHYRDKGNLATIGRAAAIAQFGKVHISGFMAWLAWLFIHILFLIGFQNRVLVLIQWAWSYFTYERGARLITGGTSLPGWTGLGSENRQLVKEERKIPAETHK